MPARYPPGLGKSGRALYRGLVAAYDLNPAEVVLATEAARVADRLTALAAELETADLVVTGSTGQPRANPLIGASALLGHELCELVRAMGLPVEGEDVGRVRSPSARDAANARWSRGA